MKEHSRQEDRDFMAKLCRKYPQLDDFDLDCLMTGLNNDYPNRDVENLPLKRNQQAQYYRDMLTPDNRIYSVILLTDKGRFIIPNHDNIFDNFMTTARKLLSKIRDRSEKDKKLVDYLLIHKPTKEIIKYFNEENLGPFQKRVVIGMLLVYFELWKNNPIMTEEQWNNKPTSSMSYRHYLSDIVEALQKKYSGDSLI